MRSANRDLILAIRAGLAAAAEPGRAPAMQAYMKSEMPYLGTRVPVVRSLTSTLVGEAPGMDADAWEDTVLAPIQDERRGSRVQGMKYLPPPPS